MKILQHYTKPSLIRWTLLFLLILAGVCIFFALQNFYPDYEQRGISIEEANSLAPYDICLPGYLPSGVGLDPYITYDPFFGDPYDSKVWIEYFRGNSASPVIRIYYIHNPTATKLDASRSISDRGPAHYWLSFWANELHGMNVETSQIKIQDSYVEDSNSYWRFIVVEPKTLQTVLIEWTEEQVFFQLYSIFPLEETQKIANSIAERCE